MAGIDFSGLGKGFSTIKECHRSKGSLYNQKKNPNYNGEK